ncbi:MAG: hypothetical protein AAGA30_11500, partial [Planctomycetota bacterium]
QHGFTTKSDGHGFGLHSCANAAQEMGGQLMVQSDGVGLGATFTLCLPATSIVQPFQSTEAVSAIPISRSEAELDPQISAGFSGADR